MKNLLIILAVTAGIAGKTNPIPVADPYILCENGTYYLYGTGSDDGIPVYVSKDMKTWKTPDGRKSQYFALHEDNSWGSYWFWAPEVYKVGDKYIMYYSCQEHICAAISDSPTGPFIQTEKAPMREHKGIDNSLFIDDDGTPYIFWVNFNNGNEVWSAELEKDCITIKEETIHMCIRMDQEWEKVWPVVNEGPFVIKHKGVYYLTYSANSYESPNYGIGYATSHDIRGKWTKYEKNPVFQFPRDLEGVGHHTLFKDAKGKGRIVFHSHNKPGKVSPRLVQISSFKFRKNGKGDDILVISDKYFTPTLAD